MDQSISTSRIILSAQSRGVVPFVIQSIRLQGRMIGTGPVSFYYFVLCVLLPISVVFSFPSFPVGISGNEIIYRFSQA